MIYSLCGTLIHKEQGMAVVECGGVGYKCSVTLATLSQLPEKGAKVQLYTYLHIREDLLDLFGFFDLAEQNCFKMLITVSGVGPKAALAILSEMTPEKFALCVATGDVKSITRAQGVGPKLAQRVILELKDKVKNDDIVKGAISLPAFDSAPSGNASEAVSALIVLGYAQSDAVRAVSKLDPALSIEQMIKQGLKELAGK